MKKNTRQLLEKWMRKFILLITRRIRRYLRKPLIFFRIRPQQDDINVIIVVRDRYDARISNAFESIRKQN